MEMESKFLQVLRESLKLEESLKELCELKEKAFEVFSNWTPLGEMNQIFNKHWKDLYHWNDNHPGVSHFFLQKGREVEELFRQVTSAEINRTEFAERLEESRNEVEECITKIEKALSIKQEELARLYDEFASSTGTFQFIFEEPNIRLLIMDKLLKSQDSEESD